MKQSLMQESGCPNLIRNITKVTCQKSDVRGVITIPWSVLSESPPKALSSQFRQKGIRHTLNPHLNEGGLKKGLIYFLYPAL